ncbi:glycosyltransferase family 77 protein [Thecamonas trahens ATCC 50062]|uniref:Glycosyltransferase family 77 protein n=1 Tax=Thecamonas trahens ATCC 50062 TaxID=461836 RepID=A0A0L0DGA4_THETB|nr:glycosyltransferase family 77 protein [Thecamonas trahens ATCC 50062]KNC51151.1 glycosyltransferase family 77 protein [Thecamonas trahens ATCC 50062]|eukprot:XP_013756353.1 glycosyltransferase family 77 protein [Thecamonas trahens ATCC 50062]
MYPAPTEVKAEAKAEVKVEAKAGRPANAEDDSVEEHAHGHGNAGPRLGLLTKEVVASIADADHNVMIAFSNYLFKDLALNLYLGAEEAGISNILVCAFDDKLEEYLVGMGVPVALLDAEVVFADSDHLRSATFKQLNRLKYAVITEIVSWGYSVLATDVDAVVMRNPFPWLKLYGQHTDMMLSTDRIHAPDISDGPDNEKQNYLHYYCIGIMYIRPTPASNAFLSAWVDAMHADLDILDQAALMQLMNEGFERTDRLSRVSLVWNKRLRTADLPTLLFCNGHVFYTQRLPQRLGFFPFMAHSTFQFGRMDGKIMAMRQHQLFHDPPEYYRGKFLAFDLNIPSDMLEPEFVPSKAVPTKHIALGKLQVAQVMQAFALARAMGRILILPRVQCLCDTYWWFLGDGCMLSGTKDMGFPTACPLDHILNPYHLRVDSGLDFRESSFLENPKVPASLLRSRVTVTFCADCEADAAHAADDLDADADSHFSLDPSGQVVAHDNDVLHFHAPTSDAGWAKRLADYDDVAVIHFSSVDKALTGLVKSGDVDYFNRAYFKSAAAWCCAEDIGAIKLVYDNDLFSLAP